MQWQQKRSQIEHNQKKCIEIKNSFNVKLLFFLHSRNRSKRKTIFGEKREKKFCATLQCVHTSVYMNSNTRIMQYVFVEFDLTAFSRKSFYENQQKKSVILLFDLIFSRIDTDSKTWCMNIAFLFAIHSVSFIFRIFVKEKSLNALFETSKSHLSGIKSLTLLLDELKCREITISSQGANHCCRTHLE